MAEAGEAEGERGLPGSGHLRGHGLRRTSIKAYNHWPAVKIGFSLTWHDELVQILAKKQLHLQDEGRQFYMEDCEGRRFKAKSKHCQAAFKVDPQRFGLGEVPLSARPLLESSPRLEGALQASIGS